MAESVINGTRDYTSELVFTSDFSSVNSALAINGAVKTLCITAIVNTETVGANILMAKLPQKAYPKNEISQTTLVNSTLEPIAVTITTNGDILFYCNSNVKAWTLRSLFTYI